MGNILTKQFYRQRKDFEDSCAGRDAGLTFPEGVDAVLTLHMLMMELKHICLTYTDRKIHRKRFFL